MFKVEGFPELCPSCESRKNQCCERLRLENAGGDERLIKEKIEATPVLRECPIVVSQKKRALDQPITPLRLSQE